MKYDESLVSEIASAFQTGKRFNRKTVARLKEINIRNGEKALDDLFMEAGRIALDNAVKNEEPPLAKIRWCV